MAEFDTGMKYTERAVQIGETIVEVLQRLIENKKNEMAYHNFLKAVKSDSQGKPVIDNKTITFFETTGHNPKVLSDMCTKVNIPNVILMDSATRMTVLAVPSQYAAQASRMFSYESSLYVQIGERVDPKTLGVIMASATTRPAPTAVASLMKGDAVVKMFDNARWIPLAQKMERHGIPMAIAQHGDSTSIIYSPYHTMAVHELDKNISQAKEPAELSCINFMERNLNKNIVECPISEGQAYLLRQSLNGASIGYNLERSKDGKGFIFRCISEYEKYIAPIVTATAIQAHGANETSLNAYATDIQRKVEAVATYADSNQTATIVDAENPYKQYRLNEQGLCILVAGTETSQQNVIIARDNPQFREKVCNVVRDMQAPVVLRGETEATKEEITRATDAAAKAQPTRAQVLLSQIVSLKTADLSTIIKDTIDTCQTLIRAVNEDNTRLSPQELAKQLKLHGTSDVVKQFADLLPKLKSDEKKQLLEMLTGVTQKSSLSEVSHKLVTEQDCSLSVISRVIGYDIHREQAASRTDARSTSDRCAENADALNNDSIGSGGQ